MVVVGTASISLNAGQATTVRVALNRTGKRLFASRHELKAKLRVAQAIANGSTQAVSTQTVTFKAKRAGRHRTH